MRTLKGTDIFWATLAWVAVAAPTAVGAQPARQHADASLVQRAVELTRSLESSSPTAADLLTQEELVAMGEDLFFNETFAGNGRTCGTCHLPGDDFGLTPATISSLPAGDLLFIAELDPVLTDLEHPPLMRSNRGLILENIDGFDQDPVFRNSPHFLNLGLTAPYGLSGEFPDLQVFTVGAVMQHFPKTLARETGVDFRLPTQDELLAMEAFMSSVFLPGDQDFRLERFVTTTAQRRGSDLFFGEAKCFNCHNGPVLADAVAELGGGNENFNTGVVNLRINLEDRPENPGGGALPEEDRGQRLFNTPPLIGVARTAPFFHDSSVQTLREAVAFYDGTEFNGSPGGSQVSGIELRSEEIDDLVAFLESLDEPTFEATPASVDFGPISLSVAVSAPVTVTLSNLVADPLTVDEVVLVGPAADQFVLGMVGPQEVEVSFAPSSVGPKRARLEFRTSAGNLGVRLSGVAFVSGQPAFVDVLPGNPFFDSVEAVFQAGLVAGCGQGAFCPQDLVTRAQAAVVLSLALGKGEVPPRRRFSDVTPTDFAAGFIERLADEGITAGCGGGNFCPSDPVTRGQMAVFLVLATGREPVDPPTGLFSDVPPTSNLAPFIERLALDGVTAGCGGGKFCPSDPLTREQMAALVAAAFGLSAVS